MRRFFLAAAAVASLSVVVGCGHDGPSKGVILAKHYDPPTTTTVIVCTKYSCIPIQSTSEPDWYFSLKNCFQQKGKQKCVKGEYDVSQEQHAHYRVGDYFNANGKE